MLLLACRPVINGISCLPGAPSAAIYQQMCLRVERASLLPSGSMQSMCHAHIVRMLASMLGLMIATAATRNTNKLQHMHVLLCKTGQCCWQPHTRAASDTPLDFIYSTGDTSPSPSQSPSLKSPSLQSLPISTPSCFCSSKPTHNALDPHIWISMQQLQPVHV